MQMWVAHRLKGGEGSYGESESVVVWHGVGVGVGVGVGAGVINLN